MGRLKNQLLAKFFTRFPKLLVLFSNRSKPLESAGIPWAPLTKKIKDSTVAIVTTAGVHLVGQPPFDMHDKNGDPTYREIPSTAPRDQYTITHDYYDHKDADKDINIVFPIDRLRELKADGYIGGVAPVHYGFMGHIDGPHIDALVNKTAVEVAKKLRMNRVDIVILTPG